MSNFRNFRNYRSSSLFDWCVLCMSGMSRAVWISRQIRRENVHSITISGLLLPSCIHHRVFNWVRLNCQNPPTNYVRYKGSPSRNKLLPVCCRFAVAMVDFVWNRRENTLTDLKGALTRPVVTIIGRWCLLAQSLWTLWRRGGLYLEGPVCETWFFDEFWLFDIRLFDCERFPLWQNTESSHPERCPVCLSLPAATGPTSARCNPSTQHASNIGDSKLLPVTTTPCTINLLHDDIGGHAKRGLFECGSFWVYR